MADAVELRASNRELGFGGGVVEVVAVHLCLTQVKQLHQN
jgi:hypothetical protein